MTKHKWTIDGLELDRRSFSLRRNGKAVRLDPKPLELLFLLVGSQGAVIGDTARNGNLCTFAENQRNVFNNLGGL
ncbi:MAG: hypothetical protein WBX22_10495 [Silvibacterium sp.]